MNNHKTDRIASDIIKYLSNIIYTETRDDILKTITLTDIRLSKDLSYAKVFFTSILDMPHKDIEKEVNEASPYLRGCLAKVIDIRNIPELKFEYDETIEYANKIEKIIDNINK